MSAVAAPGGPRPAPARPGLGRLARVELRKMVDTRAGFWLQATTALLTVVAVIAVLAAGRAEDHTFAQLLGVASAPAMVLLPVVGILLVTSEWTQRTTLITFTLVPQRSRVLAAKLLAGALLALAALVASVALAALGTAIAAPGLDGTWADAAGLVGQTAVALVASMATGVAFGAALLTSAPAIVLYFALPMAYGIVGSFSFFDGIAAWTDTSRTMGEMTVELLSATAWARALVSLLAWLALPLAIGWWRVVRSEPG